MTGGLDASIYLEVEHLAGEVDALHTVVEHLTGIVERVAGPGSTASGETIELYFADVEAFVHGLFLPMFGWRIDGQSAHWCPRWWMHAEAIWRLETLWRSWEAHRLQATGMTMWSMELDRQLPALIGPDGPFGSCHLADGSRSALHEEPRSTQADLAPDGWWE